MYRKINFLRGDTLIEVMFAVGIFGIIAVSAISLMNRGVNTAQTALETSMARNEIDAQAEALRFIHDAYAAEYNNATKEYEGLWKRLKELAIPVSSTALNKFFNYPADINSCISEGETDMTAAYTPGIGLIKSSDKKSFIINTHMLNAEAVNSATDLDNIIVSINNDERDNKIRPSQTYPQLIYDADAYLDNDSTNRLTLQSAEGIWVTAVAPESHQYYDFYIRTCWNSPGRGDPVTISTTIRLYNPDA